MRQQYNDKHADRLFDEAIEAKQAAASNPTAGDRCPHDVAMTSRCLYCKREGAANPSTPGDSGAALAIDFVVADNAMTPAVLLVDEHGDTFATMPLTDENQERAARIVQAVNFVWGYAGCAAPDA